MNDSLTSKIEALCLEGILSNDSWKRSLLNMVSTGRCSDYQIQKIEGIGISIAGSISDLPLSKKRELVSYLQSSWQALADRSDMPLLSNEQVEVSKRLIFEVSEVVAEKHLTTNFLPFAISLLKKSLKLSYDVPGLSKTLLDYLLSSGVVLSRAAEEIISYDLLSLFLEDTPSSCSNLHLVDSVGRKLFLKVYARNSLADASTRSKVEAMANYCFSSIPELRDRIAGTPTWRTKDIEDLSIGLQYDVRSEGKLQDRLPIWYWLDGYAKFTVFGAGLIEKVKVPECANRYYSYDKVEDMMRILPKQKIRKFRSYFDESSNMLQGPYLVLSDTKKDNRKYGRELDLERFVVGDLALPLPLLFASYGLILSDEDAIEPLVNFYVDRINGYIGSVESRVCDLDHGQYVAMVSTLPNADAKKVFCALKVLSFPLVLKEISGLDSRAQLPETAMQRSMLLNYLGIMQ